MNDVIPQSGGFLPVRIEANGYIVGIEEECDVHLETRYMNEWMGCFDLFSHAKKYVLESGDEEACILELTADGGGAALWMKDEQKPLLLPRRDKYKGCYGGWPVHTLNV
jgi:hypothetical protein